MNLLVSPARMDLAGKRLVFLAGSIEMGKAEDWQSQVAAAIHGVDEHIVVANPRRVAWDSSWAQSIENPSFREQVEWELDHIDRADMVVFYFQPDTLSPITLLELGKHLARGDAAKSTIVCCPDGYWRKGNVEVVCARHGLPAPLPSLDALLAQVRRWASP